ncbi:hypothetical protein LR48_Vigan03g105100 [Vigna angularis]|uniref:Uncharacterized protein n=1 Tax=Phaseolus angularis TaxID=3914 RepID=A0A0L9U5G8_PHAAN|nr:hypothetical protein LR48_Vigan03g105100 [Vigna angularis]
MAAKGKNRANALTAERVCIFGWNEANTLSSTPLKEDLGCSGYLFTFLGFYLSFFHYCSSRFTMNMCANTSNNKAPLGHPSLITHLCKLVGVDTSVPPFEKPRKAIDEAYYRQYCGGEDAAQPVPSRRARRERGPAQSQTSTKTHEVEPFQMRDMYMSLIGAQLQSIHRGQVATAEMIVGMHDTPPAHRWTMDEFHNVVAWPEEPVQGGGAEAVEASIREMKEDEAGDDDAFEDDEDEEEEEDTEDNSD